MEEVLKFLADLKQNNSRDWFNENKQRYLDVKFVVEDFVNKAILKIVKFDASVAEVEAKDSIFRIYRDTRFAHDKTPYKTHIGAFIVKGKKNEPRGGYYIHIEPGASLLSGGVWCPTPALLKSLRQDIFDNAEEFLKIVENPELKRYFKYEDEKLKKVPPPFPSDSPVSEWLKNKHYCPVCFVPDDFFTGNDALERTVERLKLLYPLNRFLNYTIDNHK